MIFDLKSGKRRRVVQIVFGFLAFVFFISFVGFGIGSDVSGGIFDALGIGGNDSSGNTQYESQIEDAEEALTANPQDETALLDLVRYHFLSATEEGVTTDPATGATEITEDSRADLERAIQRWEDYLETKPPEPDVGAATNVSQAYVLLGDADGAASAQEIVAESQNTSAAYGQLAFYFYADGQLAAGDKAAKESVALADSSDSEQIEKNLANLRKQAVKQQEAIKEAQQQGADEGSSPQLEDPFGSLGGDTGLGATAP